jgi:acetoin utilization protein AcuB
MENIKSSDTIKVADWMTETVLAVEIYDSISVARQLMAKHRVNQLPVIENERLMGIVTDRDIRDAYPTSMLIGRAKEIDKFAESYTVEEVMTHDVFTVAPETPLATAVALLRHHRIGSLPVVKGKQLVGIITRSDILDFVLSGAGIKLGTRARKKVRKKLPRGKPGKRSKALSNRRTSKIL